MRTKINLFICLLLSFVGFAQQDAQYTQYMYNTINVNPAYAGSRGVMSIFGLHRTQWVGLDGAPVTNTLSINTPIADSRVGLGLSFVNDRIGPTVDNNFSVDVSYTIPASETWNMSFGIKGSANMFNLDINKLNIYNPGDANLQNIKNDISPNVGAGIYVHNGKTYFGFSVPNMLETKRYSDNDRAVYAERMHYYLIGGHVFDLSSSVQFKPTFMFKATEGAPLQLDLSGNFWFNQKFVLGAAWRWDAAVSAMAGFNLSQNMFLGYGYDLETTKLRNYNSGSHEVFLRYEFNKKVDKIVSPRFF